MSHNAMVLNISSLDEWEPTATVLGIAAPMVNLHTGYCREALSDNAKNETKELTQRVSQLTFAYIVVQIW